MKLTKTLLHNLYIIAFVYAVLCPAIHQVDDTVYHNIIITSESRTQHRDCAEETDITPVNAFTALQISSLGHTLTASNHAIALSPFKRFKLYALSTVRLNL